MSPEMIDLARRAVACKGWRWLPGMLCIWPNGNEYRVGQVNGIDGMNGIPNYPSNGWGDDYPDRTMGHPDLTDPATLGCVLALVREAWGNADLCVTMDTTDGHWHVGRWEAEGMALIGRWGKTEAEALVAALEAAHGR